MEETDYMKSSLEEIAESVGSLRKYFNSNAPFSYDCRVQQLKQLQKLIDENEKELLLTCAEYFNEDIEFSASYRLFPIRYELNSILSSLQSYMKSTTISQPIPVNFMWSTCMEYYARGVVAIIAPWNFPVQLLLRPLVGAIAAGNCVVLKPSEVTDKVARLIARLIPQYLDKNLVRVVCGGPEETTAMIHAKLDLCMFTGASHTGKAIMRSCAEYLTPVILELGGKNPVFIDDKCDLEIIAKRILYGRLLNCGQTCLAPEYIFISDNQASELIKQFRTTLKTFYGDDLLKNKRYTRIVNKYHFDRLKALRDFYLSETSISSTNLTQQQQSLQSESEQKQSKQKEQKQEQKPEQLQSQQSQEKYKKIVIGGVDDKELYLQDDPQQRFIPPMVLNNVDFYTDQIMTGEVFGPFLSIIPMQGTADKWIEQAIDMVQSKPKPLTCYIFSQNNRFIQSIKSKVMAGSIAVNDTIFHYTLKDFPFGGVGESGQGYYGGYHSFVSFSHTKPIAKRAFFMESFIKDRYPNGNIKNLLQVQKLVLKSKPSKSTTMLTLLSSLCLAIVAIFLYFLLNHFYYGNK